MSADLDQTIAEIERGERGKLRISRRTYRGSAPFIDIRHHFPDEQTGELRPGKGVTLKEHELRDVINALLRAVRGRNGAPVQPRHQERSPLAPERSERELAEIAECF